MKDNITRMISPSEHVGTSELREFALTERRSITLSCLYDVDGDDYTLGWLVSIRGDVPDGPSRFGVGATPREAFDLAVAAMRAN